MLETKPAQKTWDLNIDPFKKLLTKTFVKSEIFANSAFLQMVLLITFAVGNILISNAVLSQLYETFGTKIGWIWEKKSS